MQKIYTNFDKILNKDDKEKLLKQKSKVIWITGLSGAGKTTLAIGLEKELFNRGKLTQILDGDNVRAGINSNLGFTEKDRLENIRRIAEVSKLFINCGIITICSFISPTIEIRQRAKNIIGKTNFVEVYVSTPLKVCEERDAKGLYKKAREGKIKNFTGIDAPFEAPTKADIVFDTNKEKLENVIDKIINKIIYD